MIAGQYLDTETGYIYLRARNYDPATAQFLSRDPADALTLSAYGYVDGNPLNETDPNGLGFWRKLGKVAGAVASDFNPTSYSLGSLVPAGIAVAAAGVEGALYGVAIGAAVTLAFAVAAPIILIGIAMVVLGAYYTYEQANRRSDPGPSSNYQPASYSFQGTGNAC